MKSSIMIFGLFAAMAANLVSFALGWDPRRDYEEMEMVFVTRCPQCGGYPSSPGVIQPDTLCEERNRDVSCVTGLFKEKQGYSGVLMAMTKNPQLLVAFMFLIVFEIVSRRKARQLPKWEHATMRVMAWIFFAVGLVLLLALREWSFVLVCYFLSAAAIISFKLQDEEAALTS